MNEGLYNLNNEDGTASLKDDGTTGTTDPTRACGLADCCDRIDGQIAEGCTAEGGVKRPANPWLQEVRRPLAPPFVLRERLTRVAWSIGVPSVRRQCLGWRAQF